MAKMNESVKMIVTLVLIAVVVAAAMAGVNMLTKDKIAENDVNKLNDSLKEVLPAEDYGEPIQTEKGKVYIARNGDEIAGYCASVTAKGYGGDINVLVGMDTEYKVTKITILSHGETPGLGANATNDTFKNQFAGKSAGNLTADKNASDDNEIQAISGATITSKGVTDAVNQAKKCVEEATK